MQIAHTSEFSRQHWKTHGKFWFGKVCEEHTVNRMLSGKAVARSLRAHMLVQSALMAHIIDAIADNGEIESLKFESVYKNVMDNGMSKDEIIELGNSDAFKRVKSVISAFIKKIKMHLVQLCCGFSIWNIL